MALIARITFAATLACVASASQAATYYGDASNDESQCVSASYAGKALGYKPTGKHKKFGDARIAGFERRQLEADACVLLGAMPGKRWVFLSQGTWVYTKGADIHFLGDCQNDIFKVVFLTRKDKDTPAEVSTVTEPVPTTVDRSITERIIVIVKQEVVCRNPDGSAAKAEMKDGRLTCPTLNVDAPVRLGGSVSVTPSPSVVVPVLARPAPTPLCMGGCMTTPAPGTPVSQVPPVIGANKLREEPSPKGICGIRVVDTSSGQEVTVGRLQLDNYEGVIRVALVREFGDRPPLKVSVIRAWASSPTKNCDEDQAKVESNWGEMVKKFGLPVPATMIRSPQIMT